MLVRELTDEMNKNIMEKILSRIGKKAIFVYPAGEKTLTGILKDRVVMLANADELDRVPYWDVVDLIQFNDQPEPWLRFGYYRMPKNRLNWASQTTLTEPLSTWGKLLGKAREKSWLRELLQGITREPTLSLGSMPVSLFGARRLKMLGKFRRF